MKTVWVTPTCLGDTFADETPGQASEDSSGETPYAGGENSWKVGGREGDASAQWMPGAAIKATGPSPFSAHIPIDSKASGAARPKSDFHGRFPEDGVLLTLRPLPPSAPPSGRRGR